VVDDERELGASLRRGLGAHGYAVDLAFDGVSGLQLGRLNPYQAIILDIMMPGLNGYLVCAGLREAGVTCPILMLTAKDGEYDEAEALDTGADDFVTKPFSYPVLLARLRAALRRGGASRTSLAQAGDLVLDIGQRRCWRRGAEIALTAKQFAVLACLVRRGGDVVTKADIIDEVWDMNYDGDVNIVEVYVRALRQRVDAPFGRASIETVRGAGYRINAHA
jgi:DNA-binding response OmpR family regulator